MKHTQQKLDAILESYLESLQDPDGVEITMDIESVLEKGGLEWQLAGKRTLLQHYESLYFKIKDSINEYDDLQDYFDELSWMQESVHDVQDRIVKLELRILKREQRKSVFINQ